MQEYRIEVVHEPTGTYMNFTIESDESEDDVWNEVMADLSVVAYPTNN